MKNALRLIFAAALIFGTHGKAFPFPLKVRDDLGAAIEILEAPKRIVSLAPSHTEILFALGLREKIVGVTDHCNCPQEAKQMSKIGGFANPDVEKIVALRPDLVLALGTIQKPVVEKLRERGLPVFWIYPRTVSDILSLFERIAEIAGRSAAGKRLRKRVEERIKYVGETIGAIPEGKKPSVFRVMDFESTGTIGGESFQSDVFHLAGGENVFADEKKDFFQISGETLVRHDPDVIIVCGEDDRRARQRVTSQKGWETLTAVQKGRILVVPCDVICRPGIRVAEAIEQIARYLYPERFPVYPRRIVSLGPSLTQELYMLEADDRIAGVTTYCQRPPEAQEKEKVGTVTRAHVEKIVSLKPDLVLVTTLADFAQVQKMKSLGIEVVAFPPCESFSQICDQFLKLGRIVGKEHKATELVWEAENRVEAISKKVKNLPRPKVFLQIGAKPLYTVTKDSFLQDLITLAGGTNIAHQAKSGLYSREEVLKQNPDVIIIVTMGIVGEEEKKTWEKFDTLKAAKKKRIYIVDSDKVCSPTPLTFAEALEEIAKLFHPEEGRKNW